MADQREWLNMSGVGQVTFMNQRSFGPPPGQQAFTTEGTFSWVAPAGVTKVSVVVVGSGRCATGGALAYKNNYSVTPGSSYSVFVSTTGGTRSYFVNACTVSAGYANLRTGDGGGNGGNSFGAGHGAGGYSGDGGIGGCQGTCGSKTGTAGTGGAGGGGGYYICSCVGIPFVGAGGGVGLLGQGSSGAGGSPGIGGGGGSGGANGTNGFCTTPNGGAFGGGRGFNLCAGTYTGGKSALRIIWPGCARSFPSTRTGNE